MIDPKKLKALRERAKLTQQQLADAAKVGQVTIARLETGARCDPPVSVAVRIAKSLGCKIEQMLD